MTDDQHLSDLRERFGSNASRVGDPPTAGDVALLLRMLDQPRCVEDAKVAEIRKRHAKAKEFADARFIPYDNTQCWVFHLADIDTLLAALDAERARAEKAERQRDMALRGSDTHDMDE